MGPVSDLPSVEVEAARSVDCGDFPDELATVSILSLMMSGYCSAVDKVAGPRTVLEARVVCVVVGVLAVSISERSGRMRFSDG